jgi:hypothetical protein
LTFTFLLHEIGYEWQKSELAGLFDGYGHLALELQGVTSDTAGQHLALLVEEFLQEFRILVIDILDAELLEAAVFFRAAIHAGGAQVLDIVLLGHCGCFLKMPASGSATFSLPDD